MSTIMGTKIIATIGPASDSREKIELILERGASSLRINTAHIQPGYISRIAGIVDRINHSTGSFLSLLVDLKGPELRTGEFPDDGLELHRGTRYTIGSQEQECDISINYPDVVKRLRKGNTILLGDGRVTLRVSEVKGTCVEAIAKDSGRLRSRSRVNIPGINLDLGVVTQRDQQYLEESVNAGVDFFALSFVQAHSNVTVLRGMIEGLGSEAQVVAKIETRSGLDNISSIARVSDWIMVARGDLGVELKLHEVAMAQKHIIRESHRFGVPTIVATQMLESMVQNPVPTRAEVSDITNAIIDNADVLMLSEETAIGKYPGEAVSTLKDISGYVEKQVGNFPEPEGFEGNQVAYSIAKASKVVARSIDAAGIVCFTRTGSTARMISAVRPEVGIYAAVTSERLARRLSLLRNVSAFVVPEEFGELRALGEAIDYFHSEGVFRFGERFVVTSGSPYFLFGGTNDLRAVVVGSFVGRGYSFGKKVQGRFSKGEEGEIVIAGSQAEINIGKKTKAVIVKNNIDLDHIEQLTGEGITVVQRTRFFRLPEEGETLLIDPGTGVIVSNYVGDPSKGSMQPHA